VRTYSQAENISETIQANNNMTLDTPEQISMYRFLALISALKLQSRGIRVTRGQSALTIARTQYGVRARTAAAAAEELKKRLPTAFPCEGS